MTPEVSIVVPTRNGVATLPALIEAIAAQTDTAAREMIVVDSGSTDGTLEVARAAADHVIEIPSSRFNHGTSRNLGLARASGRFVVLTVQDARPIASDWLTRLLAPLRQHARVAGVFARQVPTPGASAVTRDQLSRWAASYHDLADIDARPGDVRAAGAGRSADALRLRQRVRRGAAGGVGGLAVSGDADCRRPGMEPQRAAGRVMPSRMRPTPSWSTRTIAPPATSWRAPGSCISSSTVCSACARVPTVGALAGSVVSTLRAHHHLVAADGVRTGSTAWRRAMWLGVAWPRRPVSRRLDGGHGSAALAAARRVMRVLQIVHGFPPHGAAAPSCMRRRSRRT